MTGGIGRTVEGWRRSQGENAPRMKGSKEQVKAGLGHGMQFEKVAGRHCRNCQNTVSAVLAVHPGERAEFFARGFKR